MRTNQFSLSYFPMRTQENALRGVPFKNTGVLDTTTTEILKPDTIVPLSKVSYNNKVSDEDHRKME